MSGDVTGAAARCYRFWSLELDAAARELRRAGMPLPVQAKVLDLLLYLVAHRDRAVGKAELMDRVWPGVVVTDAVLTSAVRKARRLLAEDPRAADAIRTVHGFGYRFVADVASVGGASEAAAEAPAVTAGAVADPHMHRPSIIVLPFTNLSDAPDRDVLADAVSADITTLLAKHRWLEVIARNTALGFRGEEAVAPEELGTRLGVDYVVEGTSRRVGERLRITAALVDAATGKQLWGDIYDRELADVFAVQDEITRIIVGRLEPEIGMAERVKASTGRHPDLEAWELYHLGMVEFFRFTAAGNAAAQHLLQQARELDPRFGEAHAWWGYAMVLGMVYWDTVPTSDNLDAALGATQQALEIDDQNAVFYALKARVQLARCDYASAMQANETAIRLNPTLAVAYCGLGDSLAYEGEYDEALGRFQAAIELSPNDPQRWAFLSYGSLALLFKGDYEQAVTWARRALEVPNCQYWALAHCLVALAHLGRAEEVDRVRGALLAARPGFSLAFAREKMFYLKRAEQIERYLAGLAAAGIPP